MVLNNQCKHSFLYKEKTQSKDTERVLITSETRLYLTGNSNSANQIVSAEEQMP